MVLLLCPPEYQEWYRVVQNPLYHPPEYQEHPPEYQEWYRVVQSPRNQSESVVLRLILR